MNPNSRNSFGITANELLSLQHDISKYPGYLSGRRKFKLFRQEIKRNFPDNLANF